MENLILYSYRRCPYAMRARLSLAYAQVSYELREIDLKSKPTHLLEISPKGTVPVLLFESGHILEQSLDIMRWALSRCAEKLLPCQGKEEEITEELIHLNDVVFKKSIDHFKYPARYPEYSPEDSRQEGETFLHLLENHLTFCNFLVKSTPTLVDIALFPFVRQFCQIDGVNFTKALFPHLRRWFEYFSTHSFFEVIMQKFPTWTPKGPKIFITYND